MKVATRGAGNGEDLGEVEDAYPEALVKTLGKTSPSLLTVFGMAS